MSDPTSNLPGANAAKSGFSAASHAFQGFASEVQRMSKDAIEQTTHTLEKLRGAKSMEEVVSIQTAYLQQSFSNYADYTRRFSELMMSMPMEFARQGRAAFQQGADAATKATEQAGQQLHEAGNQMNQHHG